MGWLLKSAFAATVTALALRYAGITSPDQELGEWGTQFRNPNDPFFVNTEGWKIYNYSWEVEQPKAAILIAHGYGEHCGRYTRFAKYLNEKSFSVYCHDHQGFGKSDGVAAHVEDFDHYVKDILHHAQILKDKVPVPLFLFGHSMGGLIAFHATESSQSQEGELFKGTILSAPALIGDPDILTPTAVAFMRVLSDILPRLPLVALATDGISTDLEEVEEYLRDPMVYKGALKAGLLAKLLEHMEEAIAAFPEVKWPFLVIQGEKDNLVVPKGAKMLHEQAQSSDKTIKWYEDGAHELLNEKAGLRQTVKAEITSWIESRL